MQTPQGKQRTTRAVIISYALKGVSHFRHHLFNEARMDEDIALSLLNHLQMHYLFTLYAFPQSDFEHDVAYIQFISHSSSA